MMVPADRKRPSSTLVAACGTVLVLATAVATLAVTLHTGAASKPSGTILTDHTPLSASGMMPEVEARAHRPPELMSEVIVRPRDAVAADVSQEASETNAN